MWGPSPLTQSTPTPGLQVSGPKGPSPSSRASPLAVNCLVLWVANDVDNKVRLHPHSLGPCNRLWELSPQISRWECGARWSQTVWETKPAALWLLSCCLRPDSKVLSSARERRSSQAAVLEEEQRHRLLTRYLVLSRYHPAFWPLFSLLFPAPWRKETLSELCHQTRCRRKCIIPLETRTVFTSTIGTLAIVVKREAVCPLCPPLAVEDHCGSVEGKTHMLGKTGVANAFRFGACMSATWMIQYSGRCAIYSLDVSPFLHGKPEFTFVLSSRNVCKPLLKQPNSQERPLDPTTQPQGAGELGSLWAVLKVRQTAGRFQLLFFTLSLVTREVLYIHRGYLDNIYLHGDSGS